MGSQSEGDEVFRTQQVEARAEKGVEYRHPTEPIDAPREVQRVSYDAESDVVPIRPTQAMLEKGAAETIAYYEAATGQKITMDDDDGEQIGILYELSCQREAWPEALERDARTALQSIFPDVGGSAVHGPL